MAEILDIMKQLAQSQFTNSRKKVISLFDGTTKAFGPFFDMMLAARDPHPIISNTIEKKGIIVTTSDQSFMAALNSKLMKAAQEVAGKSPCEYILTGRKGVMKFKFNRLPHVGFPALKEGPMIREVAKQVAAYIVKQISENKLGKIFVVSASSASFSSQKIGPAQIFPFEDLAQNKKPFVEMRKRAELIQEGDTNALAVYAAKLWAENKLYHLFQGNKPAEFAALAMQMEGSFNNVKKVIGKLNIMYKRARNEKLDAGLREVFVSTMVIGS